MHISSLINVTAHSWKGASLRWISMLRELKGFCWLHVVKFLSPRIPFKSFWELFLKDGLLVVLSLRASSFPGRPIKSLKSLRCFKIYYCSGALNDSEMTWNIGKWLECPSVKAFVQKELLVPSRTLSSLFITLRFILTRVREPSFPKCRP